jgi:hypothetical protein
MSLLLKESNSRNKRYSAKVMPIPYSRPSVKSNPSRPGKSSFKRRIRDPSPSQGASALREPRERRRLKNKKRKTRHF